MIIGYATSDAKAGEKVTIKMGQKFKKGDIVKSETGKIGEFQRYDPVGNVVFDVDGKEWVCAETSISLLKPSPIRTVTKREVVKGVYDKLVVDNTRDGFVGLRLLTSNGEFKFNRREPKSMIETLSEIVEVMEENDA